jgi:DNA-binding NarL/FixJ family response regulator
VVSVRVSGRDPIRVLVVDDHPVVRDGVRLLFRQADGLELLGGAETAAEGLRKAAQLRPDVVLLDLRLPDMRADDVVRELARTSPDARVVIFTAYGDRTAVHAALDAGARGCLLKDAGTTDLARALRQVMAGERVVDPRVGADAEQLREVLQRTGVTAREHEVLRLVAQGRTNPEIAEALGLSRNTVKTYLQNAMQKLGARNRVEAIARANEAHLL